MCNDVCACCERDICKCVNKPKPTLNDLIKLAMKKDTQYYTPHTSIWYFSREEKKFYLQTNRHHPISHKRVVEEVKSLGHEMIDYDYDPSSNNLYTVFQYIDIEQRRL